MLHWNRHSVVTGDQPVHRPKFSSTVLIWFSRPHFFLHQATARLRIRPGGTVYSAISSKKLNQLFRMRPIIFLFSKFYLTSPKRFRSLACNTHTHTHTRLTAHFPGLPRWASTRKVNQSGFYWSKWQWVAVARAGPYASLHLAPDRKPHQHPTTQFLQAGCPSCRPTNSVKALKAC